MLYRLVLTFRQFRYLGAFYIHSLIRLFAISLFQIFSSIFIFQIFRVNFSYQQSLGLSALFFGLTFLVQAMSVAPALWLIDKKGLRFSVFWGNIFLIFYFIFLFISKYDPIFLIVAGIFAGLEIGLYWTAYHIYMTELTDDRKQGEEIAIGTALSTLAVIGGPAFGGLLISYFGFNSVFIVMTLLVILASVPLKFLPKQRDTLRINILHTVFALAPKTEKKSYIALFGLGVVDVVSSSFWPLFIFPILAGFIGLGFVGSLNALIASLTVLLVGFFIDRFGAKKVQKVISSLDSICWVARLFVNTPFRVFVTSGVQSLTTAGQAIVIDSLVYERARHTDIAAYIVQREVGLAVGRFIFLLFIGVLFWFGMPLVLIFLFAAAAALLPRYYPQLKYSDKNA